MIILSNKETGVQLGTLSEDELLFLTESLEAESSTDQDYYINHATVSMLEADGAPPELLAMLNRALGEHDGVDIVWSRE
jgi:hypothetical protein